MSTTAAADAATDCSQLDQIWRLSQKIGRLIIATATKAALGPRHMQRKQLRSCRSAPAPKTAPDAMGAHCRRLALISSQLASPLTHDCTQLLPIVVELCGAVPY